MKKTLSGLVCFAFLCSALFSPTASAAPLAGQEQFTDGDFSFTKVGDIGSYAPLNDGRNTENKDTIYFSDGLLLMRNSDMEYSYLGEDGKLHDLNRGRFDAIFPFSDGMAAVVSDNKVGYIDTEGTLVIPCQFDAPLNMVSSPYASSFKDGTAWAFCYRDGTDLDKVGWYGDLYGGWAQIDKTGKLLTDYTEDAYVGHTAPTAEVYEQYNLCCPNNTGMGMANFTEECTAPGIGAFNARFGSSDTGLAQLSAGKKDAFGQDETILYVVKRKPMAQTRYQSTAELTSVGIAELDFSYFTLTITNSTDSYDSGTIALVLASHMGTIHFVDYELAPMESKDFFLSVPGHIGVGFNEFMVVLDKGWGAYLNADIITFKSDEDLGAYLSAVVYEENLDYYVEGGTNAGVNTYVVICNGQPGDDWLKNYTGIQRHDKPHLDPEISHDICGH